jgi:hypothetical protein
MRRYAGLEIRTQARMNCITRRHWYKSLESRRIHVVVLSKLVWVLHPVQNAVLASNGWYKFHRIAVTFRLVFEKCC